MSQPQNFRLLPMVGLVGVLAACCGIFTGCASMADGKMDWVQPHTQGPRVGNVYLIRGWVGAFSGGIDHLAGHIAEQGVTSRVFQHNQCEELARMMAQRYHDVPDPEPICMIGHSFGSDDALIIARELDKVGVAVDLIITLDPVDQTIVPKNVKMCYNYWMPGAIPVGNFLRGIPLKPEAGTIGQVVNVNLNQEGRELKDSMTNHINIDEASKLHQRIIEQVLATCPERATWIADHARKTSGMPLSSR